MNALKKTLRVDTDFKNLDDAKLVADLLVDEVNYLRAQLVAKSVQLRRFVSDKPS
jgi:hypothetical protein